MATYTELFDLLATQSLKNRVAFAVMVAAQTVAIEPPATVNHANRLKWAAQAITNPAEVGIAMMRFLLATHRALTAAQIIAADDATLQTAINGAIDLFAQG